MKLRAIAFLIVAALVLAVWFGLSPGKSPSVSTGTAASGIVQDTPAEKVELLSFANDRLWTEHWQKHGREFGPNITKDGYLSLARKFFANTGKEKLIKRNQIGDTLHYIQATNEFGVVSKWNKIRTYFRPRDGIRYWNRQ